MTILIIGLVIFLGTHLVTTRRATRRDLMARFGEGPYKLGYTALSILGLVLIVLGFGAAREYGPPQIWTPPTAMRHIALLINLPIFILLASAYLPGRIKATFRPQFAVSKDPAVIASAEFVRMKAEIFGLLREEALTAQRQEEVER